MKHVKIDISFQLLLLAPLLDAVGQIGPGVPIGVTMSDYGTNSSALHNLINYGDGTLALARMASATDDVTDRGTYYSYSEDWGMTWTPFSWVEGTRQGWGNIDQFPLAEGTEIIVSHTGLKVCVDAVKGANVWSCGETGAAVDIHPRLAVTDPFNVHIIASESNPPVRATYSRSTNAGASWDILNQPIFTLPGYDMDDDTYDIAGHGSKVAIVNVSPGGSLGGDVLYTVSTDHGDTWTEHVILDQAGPGELPAGEMEFQSDGTVACVFDRNGNLHVVWCNFLAVGDSTHDPVQFRQIDAPLRYWNETTGIVDITPTVHDTSIAPLPTARGNLNTQPDIAVDSLNNIYIIYQQHISEQDTSGTYYQHIFATGSSDGGFTWREPVDVTPGEGLDASFGSMADLADSNIHLTYFSDSLGGYHIVGHHEEIPVTVMYLKHPVIDLITPVDETVSDVPIGYGLHQNYPNPFNPSTTIRFELPRSGKISLKIFNLLGEEVATLVSGVKDVGTHTVQWDATGQPSGVYFYRLRAGEFVETKKLVLVR